MRHMLASTAFPLTPTLVLTACCGLAGALSLSGCMSHADGGSRAAPRDAEVRAVEPSGADASPPAPRVAEASSEAYTDYGVRRFVDARQDNLSTFSIDVDTGSYTIARRKLREGHLPPPAAVRVEEFVNFFRQRYPDPSPGEDFQVFSEATPSPFRADKVLLRVGLQGRRVHPSHRRPANLVFLVDTSGSMRSRDKLGLLKESLAILVENLRSDDRVALCTYAGSVRKILDPTPASERGVILRALSRLEARGSTAMSSGLELAYRLAARGARPGVTTRVLVCSDGDANVGATSHEEILRRIQKERERGVTLGTIGVGMGNYKDTMLEQLADRGDGSYAYIDTRAEAERLFSEELVQNLEVIARDVKLQVAFDPARVKRYRLIGYENRAILDEDFRRDDVDAGEVGAGHSVTALYELDLAPGAGGPLGEVRLRYQEPEGPRVEERRFALEQPTGEFARASQRFRFTACVAEFAEVLRRSPHVETRLDELAALVERSLDPRHDDREHDFVAMVQRALFLAGREGGS